MSDDASRDAVAAQGPLQDAAGADVRELEYAPADPEHEALAAGLPQEWVKAAESWYSMHGSGLVRNLLAGAIPLAVAAERDRAERAEARLAEVRETVSTFRAHYAGSLDDQAADLAEGIRQVLDRDKDSSEEETP